MNLRPYQAQAIDHDLPRAFRRCVERGVHPSVLYVLPTGGGKTVTFAETVRRALAKGRRGLVMAHRYEIIDQIREALPDDDNVQAAMVQSVAANLGKWERWRPTFVVTDEAHHATAATYRKVYDALRCPHLGVTATPARTDGSGLGDVFNEMVVGPSMRDLIEAGHLSDYDLFRPNEGPDTRWIKKRGGDYAKNEAAAAMSQPKLVGSAVENWKEKCPGKRAAVFCVTVEHARSTAEAARAAGIPAEHVDGGMDRADRDAAIARFRAGETLWLTSAEIISEGFDLPAVEAAILLRPTVSLIVYLQQVGRALRSFPGKDRAIILDHAHNSTLLGLPCQAREWSLEGRSQAAGGTGSDVKPTRRCGACQALSKATAAACGYCGAEFPVRSQTPSQGDGELVLVDREAEEEKQLKVAAMTAAEATEWAASATDLKLVAKLHQWPSKRLVETAMRKWEVSAPVACSLLGYRQGYAFRLGLVGRRRA